MQSSDGACRCPIKAQMLHQGGQGSRGSPRSYTRRRWKGGTNRAHKGVTCSRQLLGSLSVFQII